jgi:tRNA threonylcarbamoyladenosine biosynthesis protein TsaE
MAIEKTYTLVATESEIDRVVQLLFTIEPFPQVICFRGDLGAGKTTLIKKICAQLGYSGEVNSPTYGLVNPYPIDNNEHTIYHSDWYRIKDLDELYDAGIEDNLYAPNSTWLIEWPQVGMEILMGFHVVDIEINHLENKRSYLITDYPLYTF